MKLLIIASGFAVMIASYFWNASAVSFWAGWVVVAIGLSMEEKK